MTPKFRKGLVALSADPITAGHLDLIRRARAECDELVVLIANNERKLGSYLFSLPERIAIAERTVREVLIPATMVIGSSGLLPDVYLREGCDVLFRGVRNEEDRRFENEQAKLLVMILPALQDRIVFLTAAPELELVSSTMVKTFVSHGLDVSAYVPLFVKQLLEERILRQWKVGITGQIAVGKSWVAERVVERLHAKGVPAHYLNIDQMVREVYDEATPGAHVLREELAALLGRDILIDGGKRINRERLAESMFSPACPVDVFHLIHHLTIPHVSRRYRELSHGKEGILVIEWAQLAEMDITHFTNNHVIVVESPDRESLLEARGIDTKRLAQMDAFQWDAGRKTRAVAQAIAKRHHGAVIPYVNRRLLPAKTEANLDLLAGRITALFPTLTFAQ